MIKKNDHKKAWIALMIAVAVLVLVGLLDNLSSKIVPSMLLTVLQKGAIYALVAVSMAVEVPPWAIRLTLTEPELETAERQAANPDERDETDLRELPEL